MEITVRKNGNNAFTQLPTLTGPEDAVSVGSWSGLSRLVCICWFAANTFLQPMLHPTRQRPLGLLALVANAFIDYYKVRKDND